MNQNDLRVIRTKESIETAFLALLRTTPLDKITVTQLAKQARINKGTFYLHYHDIYDLYRCLLDQVLADTMREIDHAPLFFTNPTDFFQKLFQALDTHLPQFKTLVKSNGLPGVQNRIVELFQDKLYATGCIERTLKNDIRLQAILHAMLTLMPNYSRNQPQEVSDVFLEMIQALFPRTQIKNNHVNNSRKLQ